ncbi:MAG TPA: hypothetical protein VFD77_00740 [Brumimicrobium sp.]|nr:hypothetical protein [Brumimicrobium sp.]
MNKLITLLLGTVVLFLASCGGGWSDDQKTIIKNECITMGGYDCDCYVDKAVESFENPESYNKKDSEAQKKFETAIIKCEVEVDESAEDNLESF